MLVPDPPATVLVPDPPAPTEAEAPNTEPPPPLDPGKLGRKKRSLELDDGLDIEAASGGTGDLHPPRPGARAPAPGPHPTNPAPARPAQDAGFAAELHAVPPEATAPEEPPPSAEPEPAVEEPAPPELGGLTADDLKPPFWIVYRRQMIGFGGLVGLAVLGIVTSLWLDMGWFFSKRIEASVNATVEDVVDLRDGPETLVKKVQVSAAQASIDRGTYEALRSAVTALSADGTKPEARAAAAKAVGIGALLYDVPPFRRTDLVGRLAELPTSASSPDAVKARAIGQVLEAASASAAAGLAELVRSTPNDKEALVLLGLAEARSSTIGRGIATIDRALVLDTHYPLAWIVAGRLLMRSDPAISAELLARGVRFEPNLAIAATTAASLFDRLERPGDHRRMLAAAADGAREGLPPERRAAVSFEAAVAFEDAGRPNEMARFATQAYELDPRNPTSLVILTRAQAELGLGDAAERMIARALSGPAKSAADVPALLARAEAYFAKNELAKAFGDVDAAKALAPRTSLPYYVEGRLNLKLAKFEAAKDSFLVAQKREGSPEQLRRATIWRARTELALGEVDRARETAAAIVAADPTDVTGLDVLAECQRRRGELTAARKTFETSIALDADDDLARLGLAATLRDLAALHPKPKTRTELAVAEVICVDVMRRNPSSTDVLFECGRVLEVGGRTAAALDLYREAAFVDDRDGRPYIAMASALMVQRVPEPARARAMLDEAMKRAPNNPDVQYWLGRIEYEQGAYDQARTALEAAIKGSRARPDFHLWLGRALKKQERIIEAISEWEEALVQNANDVGSIRELAIAARDQNSFGRAQQLFERYRKAVPEDMSIWRDIGETYQMMGKDAEAQGAWKKVLEVAPDDAVAILRIGLIEAKRGNSTEALAKFERALAVADDGSAAQGEALCLVALAKAGAEKKAGLERCVKHPKAPEDLVLSAKKALENR